MKKVYSLDRWAEYIVAQTEEKRKLNELKYFEDVAEVENMTTRQRREFGAAIADAYDLDHYDFSF